MINFHDLLAHAFDVSDRLNPPGGTARDRKMNILAN